MNNTYTDELAAEKAVNKSLMREVARLTKLVEGNSLMSRKIMVFEHEGKLYATTNYEPIDEQKLADVVTDISSSLEEATIALQRYSELALQFPQVKEEPVPEAPAPDVTSTPVETTDAQPAPAETVQPAGAVVETQEPTPVIGEQPESDTPPAEATRTETVHIQ